MKHRDRTPEQDDLLRPRLVDLIDMRHELVKLAVLIDWEWFKREWAGFFPSKEGRRLPHRDGLASGSVRTDRGLVLKERLAGEVLKVRVLNPAGDHRMVRPFDETNRPKNEGGYNCNISHPRLKTP